MLGNSFFFSPKIAKLFVYGVKPSKVTAPVVFPSYNTFSADPDYQNYIFKKVRCSSVSQENRGVEK